jgi:hypothetical protein
MASGSSGGGEPTLERRRMLSKLALRVSTGGLVAVALMLVAAPANSQSWCAPFMTNVTARVAPWTERFTTPFSEGAGAYTPGSWTLPMTVPAEQWAGIKSIYFSSKHIVTNGNFRNSYAIIHNVTTITETQPGMTFDPPIILPPGFVINGEFSNASSETQNMILQITGYLTNQQSFAKCLGWE